MQVIPGSSDKAGRHATAFAISGRVEETRGISLDELLGMEMIEFKDLLLACGSGVPKGQINSCRGVPLTDVINLAKVVITDHNDTKRMYVVASAGDGYTTVFSWQELFNTSVGEGVIVLLEKDGRRVYEANGSVDLFSARDILTGPRYVKKLSSLRVLMVE